MSRRGGMPRTQWWGALVAFGLASSLAYGQSPTLGRFPDAREAPPDGWSGPVFKLSQDYPPSLPAEEDYPWKRIDPKTQPDAYLRAVLSYAIEGNEASDWDGAENKVRKWFNAP